MKDEQAPEKKFDLKTHVRDPKSGRVIRQNLYSLHMMPAEGGGTISLYERPIGSGIFYYENGELAKERSVKGLQNAEKNAEEAKRAELQNAEKDYKEAMARYEAAKANQATKPKQLNSTETK